MSRRAALMLAGAALVGAGDASQGATPGYVWDLPAGFPEPLVPADNPMTTAKVELGRLLFYDRRLSINGRQSCASCHQQALAFTDGRAQAVGTTDETLPRSTMSLTNVAYNATLTWAEPGIASLERQLRMPLLSRRPIELGLAGAERALERTLASDDVLRARFALAFPGEARPVRMASVGKALAAFERTLISGASAYDRLLFQGDREALSPSAKRGMELFFSARLACSRCHAGFNLSGPVVFTGSPPAKLVFHNTNLNPATGHRRGAERFRAPALRNVAVTAPYMHDGSIASLAEVVDHYAAGGRARPPHPARSPLIAGFTLGAGERDALIDFLESLTDPEFLRAPRFGPPS